ncbi:MAG: MinD/ParA family ATP-binding protein [Nocardioides sp.]
MSDDQPPDEQHRQDPPAHRAADEPAEDGPVGWQGLEPDTSERLFAVDELAAYEQSRMDTPTPTPTPAPTTPPHGDPLTGPIPGLAPPSPPAGPPPGRVPPSAPSLAAPPTAPPAPSHAAPPAAPPAAPSAAPPVEPAADPSVPRFMSATDFLDRRSDQVELGPATWGWRGKVHKWSGGAITPRMGPAETQYEHDRRAIQRDFEGPRTVAFLNPKGGAAKTTGVLAAGYTFGTVRGGGVVAWDNNETRGTLGIRGHRSTHRNTTRELLEDLERFSDAYQARIGDLGAFVRSQGDAHFDILASDERPHVTGMIRAQDFSAVHQLLERFYRLILVDSGNNMRAENWLAAVEAADLLVVTSTIREDTGYSGLWMLDALQDAGYENLKHKTVTVLSDPSSHVDEQLAHDLVQVYEQRTKAVYRVPYDPVLVSGSVVPYARLSEGTRSAWLKACAGMSELL